ncbi:hypothetical protein Bca101_064996 [Brassica carinata]
MQRRLSSSEKGKAIALQHLPAPRKARVRVAEPDISTLKEKHSLTIIGRVTNPSMQKVWSLIPFFTEHWKADIPPVGSDLGLGMFQFQFELESDLLTVLEKQPYHYARWMIILQRWEPTISPDFPSMIPFWIRVQGIPIHLWRRETIQTLGEDLGTFETSEITSTSIRMRVHVNGRLPLIKSSVIEYPNGDEVTATLLYERLERHCSFCHKLDHEVRDCLEAKHQKKALNSGPEAISSDQGVRVNASLRQNNETTRRPYHHERHSARREEVTRRSRSGNHTDGTSFQSKGHNEPYQRGRAPQRQEWHPRASSKAASRSVSKNDREFFSGDSHRAPSLKERYHRREPHREETHTPINRHTSPQEVSSASRNRQPPSERGVPHQMCSSGLAPEAVESALEKIKDTMALYIKCADPSESAARMERLRQAEALGVLEKNAANMVRKANCRAHTSERPPEMDIGMPSSQERTPISARLGPLNAESPPSDRVPVSARLGPLPGEPPAPDGLNPSPGNTGSRIPISARLRPMTEEEVLGGTSNYEVPLTKKRKPGRPPGIRKNIPPEGSEPNGISRKRKSIAEKPPTGSKKTGTEAVRPRKVTKNLRNKRGTPRTRVPSTPTSSENLPIANMIPPAARRRMDFRAPSNPVP